MRKAFFIALLFVSTIVAAQDIQNTFYGFKLDNALEENTLAQTMESKYSTHLRFRSEYPLSVGTANSFNFGGIKWDVFNFVLFMPMKKFYAIELFLTEDKPNMVKESFESLMESLTKKYGQPIVLGLDRYQWEGKNSVNVLLEIEEIEADGVRTTIENGRVVTNNKKKRLYLTYWSTNTEKRLKQFQEDQL